MEATTVTTTADLCVIGSGIAALNAVAVASTYLERGQRIVLIERRGRSGGMWVDTYPFVRLHQPHRLFTAGSIGWESRRPPAHLATRDEVLDHFTHVVDVVRRRVDLEEYYGWEFESHAERGGRVLVRARGAGGRELVVDTARLIKAFGIEVGPDLPLPVSSNRVRSITPTSLEAHRDELLRSDEPIWIAGGGKTAMDTAHRLITTMPGREVNMLTGAGTFFSLRDRTFPTGRARWRPRATSNMLNVEMARRFDGTNEDAVRRWLHANYGISLVPNPQNYFFGLLSGAENATIAGGLKAVVPDYFADVQDRGDRTDLILRSGETRELPAGTWLVNCTGFIKPTDRPYEPYTSPSGAVLTISLRSITALLSSFMSYFMTHMMFCEQLATTPLYELDYSELARVAKPVAPYVVAAQTQYNVSLMSDLLPPKAFLGCALDFDRWYPLPHRVAAIVAYTVRHKRNRPGYQRALDTARCRFDVRCGPLPTMAA